jgi:hypothetical protein
MLHTDSHYSAQVDLELLDSDDFLLLTYYLEIFL